MPVRANGDPPLHTRIEGTANWLLQTSMIRGGGKIVALDTAKLPTDVDDRPLTIQRARYRIASNIIGRDFGDFKKGEPTVIVTGPDVEKAYGTWQMVFRYK